MKRTLLSETDMAKKVIWWLEDSKWDVYKEVQLFAGSSVADIVGLLNKITWVIETKTSLSLRVMSQADQWLHLANMVSVAVPSKGMSKDRIFAMHVLRTFGIGLITISPSGKIEELVGPSINRNTGPHLRDVLTPHHKTFAEAGNSEGLRWSPWKQTCNEVKKYLSKNPGASIKDVVENVETHYRSKSTARSCLYQWVSLGKITGVRAERDGRKLKYYFSGDEVGNE